MSLIQGTCVVDLHERDARIFPRDQLFDSKGQSLVLHQTQDLGAVELREVVTGVEVRVLGLIGYLPLTARITLNLQPKFRIRNLWEMLAGADETYSRFLPVSRLYETASVSAPQQLLARGFCHYLSKILTVGMARGYYQESYGGYFKPKVNFGRTVAEYLARGEEVKVASETFVFTANHQVNGLIKAGCLDFIRVIPRTADWREQRECLLETLSALHNIAPIRMHVGDQLLSSKLPMRVRDAYLGALTVYSMLLGFTDIGFAYSYPGNEMPSFLFKLDGIFERFVRNTFRSSLNSQSINVLNGNIDRLDGALFVDNTEFRIKPDLVFQDGKRVLGIGEVKYKPKLDDDDRYQLISYVVATGAPIGVWISPAPESNKSSLEYIGKISTGAQLFHYRLDIAGELDREKIKMLEQVTSFLVAARCQQ